MTNILKLASVLSLLVPVLLANTSSAQDNAAEKPVKLSVAEVSGGGIVRQFFGNVVARQTVDLAFQVAGQIIDMPVIEGQVMPKGDVIAELDLETFQLSLDQSKLRLEQADRNYERLKKLQGSSVSEVAVQDAETELGLATIAVANAEYALEHATLHAPFDALVATRFVDNFTTIGAGTPVVRLHDMSELRIEIDVPEILFQRAGEDPDVEVTARFPFSDQVFPLTVREFNAETSAIGQTFRLTFGMPPPEGLSILPGASVTVTAVLKEGPQGVMVPASAIRTAEDGGVSMFVFEPAGADQGTLTRRDVTLAPDANGQFLVTEGLEAGEEFAAAGIFALEDGQSVRRFSGFTN